MIRSGDEVLPNAAALEQFFEANSTRLCLGSNALPHQALFAKRCVRSITELGEKNFERCFADAESRDFVAGGYWLTYEDCLHFVRLIVRSLIFLILI